ncbi:MAG TPA: ATP-binding protein [Phototrophicaceae bacterium]|nr:ATP-binding protein [Phototrophicaceae bacterium]
MSLIEKLFASIQSRLLAVLLLITLLTVAIVITFNQWLRVQLITEADNALLVSAAQIANQIDEFNRSNRQVFNVGSRLPDLVEFLEADEAARNNTEFRDRILVTLDSLAIEPWDEYYILSQAILDRNGRNILDTAPDNIGVDESQQDYFQAARLGGAINISPIQYRPERSGIYFYYAVPIRQNTIPNPIIGVLRIQIAIATIQNIVSDSVRGQHFNVAIFDENAVRVVDTRHESLLFRSIASFSPEQIVALRSKYAIPPLPDEEISVPIPGLVKILSNSYQNRVVSGYMTPDSDQEERLAIVRLETVPWHLVVSQPTIQYFQTVQQQTTGILILAISLTLVALAASYFISNRITKPIRTLTAVAKQVAEGQLHIKAPVTSSDEVGTLAKTFNLMTTELELAHATLEDRVEKRTQELSEANEKLKHEIIERQRYERQALELALEHERRRILAEFIQKASHEFKTPLSIVNVNTYLAKRFLPTERQRYMSEIEEQGKYIDGLVNRMVLMSRLDSDISTPLKHLQLDKFIRTLHTRLARTFLEKQAFMHLELQAANTWVYADPELLSLAVENILDNALKFSDKPVEISIKTDLLDEMAAVRITDNGIGMAEEVQARVFERFFRGDVAHTTRGFGLGLPIAKRIVENLGGTIELESVVGTGTTVTIKLPSNPPQLDCEVPPTASAAPVNR